MKTLTAFSCLFIFSIAGSMLTGLSEHALASEESQDIVDNVTGAEPMQDSHDISNRREVLKLALKQALVGSHGSTNTQKVKELIEELSALNPCQGKVSESGLLMGAYQTLTGPDFPGRIKPEVGEESVVKYTLGRLSFNIFQPKNLVCTLHGVRNNLFPMDQVNDQLKEKYPDRELISYPLILDITIHTPEGDLPAVLQNDAFCFQNENLPSRLMVSFQGGTLSPAEEVRGDASKLQLWSDTFQGAYQEASKKQSIMGHVFQYAMTYLLGLNLPTDDEHNCEFRFDMKRSPVGYLDVLYLDHDLRITRGNRGTIVVVERLGGQVLSK